MDTIAFSAWKGIHFAFPILVSDPTLNGMIKKNIKDALSLVMAKQDAQNAGRSDLEANLNYVVDLVYHLLTYVYSLVSFLLTVPLSGISGLIKGLIKGIGQKGLVGGLGSGAKGLVDGLGIGSIKGFGSLLSNLLA